MRSDKSDDWIKAIGEEMVALQDNSICKVVKSTPGSNGLHTKGIHKTKPDTQGKLEWMKARLIAFGNKQC